jgi:hypothetical protein
MEVEVYFGPLKACRADLRRDYVAAKVGREPLAAIAEPVAKTGAHLSMRRAEAVKLDHGHRWTNYGLDNLADFVLSTEGSVFSAPLRFRRMGLVGKPVPAAVLASEVFSKGSIRGEVEHRIPLGSHIDFVAPQSSTHKGSRGALGFLATCAGGHGVGDIALPAGAGERERVPVPRACRVKFVDSVG